MADNVTLPGTAEIIAADEVSGAKVQRVKPAIGADGSAVDAIGVSNGLDSTGAGIPASGIVGQFDDAATGAVTENQFAPVRISTRRALLVEGVASGTAQPVSGTVTANAGSGPFPVSDNAGSLTVDAPLGTPVFVTSTPNTTGGWDIFYSGALSNSANTVKASTGTLGGWYVYNPHSAVVYIQFFDASSPSVGTPRFAIGIPPGSAANLSMPNGILFGSNSIKVAATTTPNGSTAPATAPVVTLWFK